MDRVNFERKYNKIHRKQLRRVYEAKRSEQGLKRSHGMVAAMQYYFYMMAFDKKKVFLFYSIISPPFGIAYCLRYHSSVAHEWCRMRRMHCRPFIIVFITNIDGNNSSKDQMPCAIIECLCSNCSYMRGHFGELCAVCYVHVTCVNWSIWTFVVIAWSLNAFPEWYNVFEMEFRQWLQLYMLKTSS